MTALANSIKRKYGKNKPGLFDIAVFLILTVWAVIIVFPFYNAVMISLVSTTEYVKNPVILIPHTVTFDAYKYILQGNRLLVGYKTTGLILLFGLPYNLVLTILVAYALSHEYFPGKKAIVGIIYFTMLFSGGIVPVYLLIKGMGLTDTLASVILIYGINTFYLILTRTYFETLPASMAESARLDGANEFVILIKIIIPLAMPIIATITLFYAVDRWNEWFNAMLFIKRSDITPLQLILRNIIDNAVQPFAETSSAAANKVSSFTEGVKMASIVMTMAPVMVIYPFLQKYFVKGIMVGAVKA